MSRREMCAGLELVLIVIGRVMAFLLCILGFPLHLLIRVAVKINDGSPTMHRCYRLGKSGAEFELFKYRSMRINVPHHLSTDLKMVVHSHDPRVTSLGRWLRCGIDELPQLWNIVRGEMMWIGPRPDPQWMLPHYGLRSRGRLSVLPGITGFAQVLNSRNLSTAEGYALDIWYLSHVTLWLNAWIILVTPPFVAGWRSVGEGRLSRLRRNPEFLNLICECDAELANPREVLLASVSSETLLPPNTVIC
jgi:lipopolysaccharide/colanic/teichoic acid biosynthesis glycosyltransferase